VPTTDGTSVIRYHLNALFDLELGRYSTAGVERAAAEMSVLFLPCGTAGDEIVFDVKVDDSYLSYLSGYGLLASGVGIHFTEENGIRQGDAIAEFWGWNSFAAAEAGPAAQSGHPPVDVVAEVNGRRFCSALMQKYGTGVPGSHFFSDAVSFDEYLRSSDVDFPLVIKPAFGSSGYGLIILMDHSGYLTHASLIDSYCSHGGFVAEPWCTRIVDIGSAALILPDGSVGNVRMHRQLINRYGAFYGIAIDSCDPVIGSWGEEVAAVTERYGREAAASGYFGPLGIDSFVYHTAAGKERLAAGIEINGRYTMGYLAHRIRNKIARDRCMMMRLAGRKRCRLPETCKQFDDLMGNNRYDPVDGKGIILLTPPRARYKGQWRQPQQNVFVLVAPDGNHLEKLDRFLLSMIHRQDMSDAYSC